MPRQVHSGLPVAASMPEIVVPSSASSTGADHRDDRSVGRGDRVTGVGVENHRTAKPSSTSSRPISTGWSTAAGSARRQRGRCAHLDRRISDGLPAATTTAVSPATLTVHPSTGQRTGTSQVSTGRRVGTSSPNTIGSLLSAAPAGRGTTSNVANAAAVSTRRTRTERDT